MQVSFGVVEVRGFKAALTYLGEIEIIFVFMEIEKLYIYNI